MQWQNAPKTWKQSGTSLIEGVPAGTDYWRTTHYGFIRTEIRRHDTHSPSPALVRCNRYAGHRITQTSKLHKRML
jgi:hypothetical protein